MGHQKLRQIMARVPVRFLTLPEVALDQTMSNFTAAVRTSAIDATNKLVDFQGDLTFDERGKGSELSIDTNLDLPDGLGQ